jgi:hypothetical protein
MIWKLVAFPSESGHFVQHVVPVDDLREHDLMPDCWCDPAVDHISLVAVHNAADQREKFESGERKPS